MHQPFASLLIAGIKTVEGRSWATRFRGTLWIASTARKPSDKEIRQVTRRYARDAQQAGRPPAAFPDCYPPSALLGCVHVADCLPRAAYAARPAGEACDASFVWLCAQPKKLVVGFNVAGKHKLWPLEPELATAAKIGILPLASSSAEYKAV